jgi:NADH:ubiquinone oxidoreductase subunit 4 (subunit M)
LYAQTDRKSLIAYSSVAHMGIVIDGVTNVSWGSFTLMIAHGLFCLSAISYERLGNRSFLNSWCLYKNFMPRMAVTCRI